MPPLRTTREVLPDPTSPERVVPRTDCAVGFVEGTDAEGVEVLVLGGRERGAVVTWRGAHATRQRCRGGCQRLRAPAQ